MKRTKLRYQNALKAEVHENVNSKLEKGLKGHELVNEVKRVAKSGWGQND